MGIHIYKYFNPHICDVTLIEGNV